MLIGNKRFWNWLARWDSQVSVSKDEAPCAEWEWKDILTAFI